MAAFAYTAFLTVQTYPGKLIPAMAECDFMQVRSRLSVKITGAGRVGGGMVREGMACKKDAGLIPGIFFLK